MQLSLQLQVAVLLLQPRMFADAVAVAAGWCCAADAATASASAVLDSHHFDATIGIWCPVLIAI